MAASSGEMWEGLFLLLILFAGIIPLSQRVECTSEGIESGKIPRDVHCRQHGKLAGSYLNLDHANPVRLLGDLGKENFCEPAQKLLRTSIGDCLIGVCHYR